MNRTVFSLVLAAVFAGMAARPAVSRPAMSRPAATRSLHPSLPSFTVPSGAGVNIHFTDPRPGEVKMLSQSFRFVRMDFVWSAIEYSKGRYDFSAYDRLLHALDPYKVRPLFIFDYANDFYDGGLSPHTDEGRAAMARWAAASVTHFKGRGVLWEMFNEPNIGFWKPAPDVDDYILLAKAVATAVHNAAPNEPHFGAATSGVDLKFLEACFKAGLLKQWDAVSVHPYRQSDPETASDDYRKLRLLIARYKPKGKTIPIISGEWGYSTAWDNFNDERQAKYLPRQWMTNLMNDVPLSIWYDWHDDGIDPKEAEHHFGTVGNQAFEGRDPPYNPKPSYVAARAWMQTFDGYTFNKRLALSSPDDYLLLFTKSGNVKLAAWTTSKNAHTITIPAAPGLFRVTNYLGQAQADAAAKTGGLKLTVSDAPLYLQPIAPNSVLTKAATWKRMPLEILVQAPQRVVMDDGESKRAIFVGRNSPPQSLSQRITVGAVTLEQQSRVVVTNPLSLFVFPAPNHQLAARLQNPSGEAFAGRVSVNGGAAKSVFFDRGETEKTLLLPRPISGTNGIWKASLRFQGAQKEDVVEETRSFRPFGDFAQQASHRVLDLSGKSYRVVPDGDAKIVSEQSLSVAQPPDGASPEGGASLKLSYRMEPGWKFLQIQPLSDSLKKVEGQPKALGLWVYGDGSNNTLRMRFRDASGQTFQPGGAPVSWKGWRFYEFPIDNTAGSWGGDGVLHWPIRVDTLALLDSDRTPNNKGEIYFSAPMWIY